MRRTQLYLDDELWGTLRIRSKQAGTSVSHLVRQAVREKYSTGVAGRQQAMQAFAGIWKDRADLAHPEAYLRALRKSTRAKRLR
ncbi:MAG TPA: ribbon-helix-helix protein, CopG family [Terriglobia bacterium]|nr:ribbon-helix-helix protein, CopG family [Terriglobia bacterium]